MPAAVPRLTLSPSFVRPTPVPADQQPSRRKAFVSDGDAAERGLARRIAGGDPGAVAELFDLVGTTLYALAFGITHDPTYAEEAVEEAFADLWESRARLDISPALSLWLAERCRIRALALRTGARVLEVHTQMAESDGHLAGRLLRCPPSIRPARVNTTLGGLSPREREALELASRDGLSVVEIGRRLGVGAGEVHELLRKGLQSLRMGLERTLRRESS